MVDVATVTSDCGLIISCEVLGSGSEVTESGNSGCVLIGRCDGADSVNGVLLSTSWGVWVFVSLAPGSFFVGLVFCVASDEACSPVRSTAGLICGVFFETSQVEIPVASTTPAIVAEP